MYSYLEDITNIHKIADWIELYVLLTENSLSKVDISNILEQRDGFDGMIEEESEVEELKYETKVNDILRELRNRQKKYGINPPYKIENFSIVIPLLKWDERIDYTTNLILNITTLNPGETITKHFENLSKEAVKNYITGCFSDVVGAPNNLNGNNLIQDLCIKTGEKKGNLPPTKNFKDGGVDVVLWVPFEDNRTNKIIIFVQSAAGKNWHTKKPICKKTWQEMINFSVYPIESIALPFIISDDDWSYVANTYGLLFDRIRLYLLLKNNSLPQELQENLIKYCQEKKEQLLSEIQ